MKLIITFWILIHCIVFPQPDCQNFETLIKKVDKNYAELSQSPLQNYIKYNLSQNDTFKTGLYNVKGELVFQKNFGLLDVSTYVVKFFNPKCPGVYFVSIEIGNQPVFKKAIQITSEEFPSKEIEINAYNSASTIEGIWKRSYSEKFIPTIQFFSGLNKTEHHYKYDLRVHFSKDFYKIISERTAEEDSGKTWQTIEGKFIVKDDTLKLYEDSKLNNVFQYKIEKDTLSITHFVIKDEKTGTISIPIEKNINDTEIKLIGKYHK